MMNFQSQKQEREKKERHGFIKTQEGKPVFKKEDPEGVAVMERQSEFLRLRKIQGNTSDAVIIVQKR